MARFSCNDIDGLVLSLEEVSELPGDVVDNMLLAGAEVIKKAHIASINRHFDKHTAKLIGSPRVFLKTGVGKYGHAARERFALIYPEGEHHIYHAKTGDGVARNADVGFVQEFGGHGNNAVGWMREANDLSADAMASAEEKVYDAWLKSKNL